MKKTAKSLAASICLAVLFSLPSAAQASGCYKPNEFEAEQGLRIHSELMVIALTCIKMPSGGPIMYSKYQAFTLKNQNLIARYETDMIGYYRRQGMSNPEGQFNTMRTGLANKISKSAITMSTSSFCQRYSTQIDYALSMDQAKFRRWAQHATPSAPTSRPPCRA